ncbi:hypothetical protein HMPREF1090_02959 [[Clostridium] clostridioforme 90A8]|uniref:DUF4428 domain-containing protein n=2 Tax=Enterocloster clostridioformis TaxID=1531 RepID=A0A0E2H9U6_9FIRM|nr:hypothetical protein HMPREF1090_02959 [[Clostridium] clostridioforme 90A8]
MRCVICGKEVGLGHKVVVKGGENVCFDCCKAAGKNPMTWTKNLSTTSDELRAMIDQNKNASADASNQASVSNGSAPQNNMAGKKTGALSTVGAVIRWIIGALLILGGVVSFKTSAIGAIMYILAGLFMMPISNKIISGFSKKRFPGWICVILACVFVFAGAMSMPASDAPSESEFTADISAEEPQTSSSKNDNASVDDEAIVQGELSDSTQAEIVDDGIIEKLKSFGFTDEEAAEARELFIMCGVTNIDACEPTDSNATIDGLASFRAVWDADRTFWFTVDHREVFYMSLNGTDVYDKDQGGFLINVNDVHVPESTVTAEVFSDLQNRAEAELDKYFIYTPYYDAWGMAREDDNYMIQCQADAKNRLGTKRWVTCIVWFEADGDDFRITGVSIDGQQMEIQ